MDENHKSLGTDDKLFMYSIQQMKEEEEEGGVAVTLYMLFFIPFPIAFSWASPAHQIPRGFCSFAYGTARRKSDGWMRELFTFLFILFFFFFSFSIFSFELHLTQNIVSNKCMQFFNWGFPYFN
jgi:hypothetical protein